MAGRLVGFSIGWLVGRMDGWLVWLVVWLVYSLVGWFIWLIDRSMDLVFVLWNGLVRRLFRRLICACVYVLMS